MRDDIYSVGGLGEEGSKIIGIDYKDYSGYMDSREEFQLVVRFDMSLDAHTINRSVYTLLDVLGDVGGLSGSLFALFNVLVVILNLNTV